MNYKGENTVFLRNLGNITGEGNGNPLQYSLAWKIPWREEPGRLQSMGSLRVRHDWATSLREHHFSLMRHQNAIRLTKNSHMPPKVPRWAQDVISVGLLLNMNFLQAVMRKHAVNPNWGTFYKTAGLYSSQMSRSWMLGKGWRTVVDYKRLQRQLPY